MDELPSQVGQAKENAPPLVEDADAQPHAETDGDSASPIEVVQATTASQDQQPPSDDDNEDRLSNIVETKCRTTYDSIPEESLDLRRELLDQDDGFCWSDFAADFVSYAQLHTRSRLVEKVVSSPRQLLELSCFLAPGAVNEGALIAACSGLLHTVGKPEEKTFYKGALEDIFGEGDRDEDRPFTFQNKLWGAMDQKLKCSIFGGLVRALWARWPAALPALPKSKLPLPASSNQISQVDRRLECATIYPHIANLHYNVSFVHLQELPEDEKLLFAKLLIEAQWSKDECEDPQLSYPLKAEAICKASSHEDRDATLADVYFYLGAILMESGNFESSAKYKNWSFDLLAKFCQDHEVKRERLSLAYEERGIARIQDGQYKDAEADIKEAIQLRKSSLEEHEEYIPGSCEANLGWALIYQRQYEQAEALLMDSLMLCENAFDKHEFHSESPRTGLLYHALGSLKETQGKLSESVEHYYTAYKSFQAGLGSEDKDPYTARAAHSAAEQLLQIWDGQVKDCRKYPLEDALGCIDKALGAWPTKCYTYKCELARSFFLKAQILDRKIKVSVAYFKAYWEKWPQVTEEMRVSLESKHLPRLEKGYADAMKKAHRLWTLSTMEERDASSLTMKDFDMLVPFWSRRVYLPKPAEN